MTTRLPLAASSVKKKEKATAFVPVVLHSRDRRSNENAEETSEDVHY